MGKTFKEYFAEAVAKLYVAKLCELPIIDNDNPENPEDRTHPMRETLDIFMEFLKTNIKSKDEAGEKQDHLLLSSAIMEASKPGIGKFYNNDYFNAYTLLKLIEDEENSEEGSKVFLHMLKATIVKMLENHANNKEEVSMENAELARQHATDVINLVKTYFDPKPVKEVIIESANDPDNDSDKQSETAPVIALPETVPETEPEPEPEPESEPVPETPQEPDNTEMYSTLLDLAIDILSATPDSVNPSTDEILLDLSIDILRSNASPEQQISTGGGRLFGMEKLTSQKLNLPEASTFDIQDPTALAKAKIKSQANVAKDFEDQMQKEKDKLAAQIQEEQDKLATEAQKELEEAVPGVAMIKKANPLNAANDIISDTQKSILEEIQNSLGPENKMTYKEIHSKLLEIITDALKYHIKGEDSDHPSKEGIQATLRIFETYMNRQVRDFIEGENITLISLITIFKESEKMRTFLEDILREQFIPFLNDPNHINEAKWSDFADGIASTTISKLEAKLQEYVVINNPLEELYKNMEKQGFTINLIDKKRQADNENRTLGLDVPAQQGGYSNMYSVPKSLQKTLKTYSNSAFRNIRNIDSANDLHKNNVSKKHRRHILLQ